MKTNTLKKYVQATSLEGAQVAASLGNFLDKPDRIDAAFDSGNLYCVEVTIEAGDTSKVSR